jgi:hypothetical protein
MGLNPFLPFVGGIKGYQQFETPDPREGKYVFVAHNPNIVMSSFKLKSCYWLDQRTQEVKVNILFWSHSTQEVGSVEHTVSFDYLGAASPSFEIQMADFYDRDRTDGGRDPVIVARILSILFINFIMIHKSFLQLSSYVMPHLLPYLKRVEGEPVKTRRQPRQWTIKKACLACMDVMCEMLVFAILTMFTISRIQERTISATFFNAVADVGKTGNSRMAIMLSSKIDSAIKEQLSEKLDSLAYMLLSNVAVSERLQLLLAFFMMNNCIDLMRHFYANPHFSMVPKTLTFSLTKIVYLLTTITTMQLLYGTFVAVNYGQYGGTALLTQFQRGSHFT